MTLQTYPLDFGQLLTESIHDTRIQLAHSVRNRLIRGPLCRSAPEQAAVCRALPPNLPQHDRTTNDSPGR
ncbi:hypothetical protein NITLEN_90052 [Nitrospira lenta]|uniref:Uncharacterized protein n=1 Tax=Nitrospira lenta TaxID=1436998 RepID=A0A330LBX2_9BACT|nr:hypothetical protein NITLEN_90052 [Nitrospira lenta]